MARIPNKWFADIWIRPNDTHCSGSPTAGERTYPGLRNTRYVTYLVQYLDGTCLFVSPSQPHILILILIYLAVSFRTPPSLPHMLVPAKHRFAARRVYIYIFIYDAGAQPEASLLGKKHTSLSHSPSTPSSRR